MTIIDLLYRFNVVYHLLGFVINLFYLKKIEYEYKIKENQKNKHN